MITNEIAVANINLLSLIKEHINRTGKITFAEFMHHALYSPGLGYYSADTIKFGKQGDFITAPEIGNLFAQCLANHCKQICMYSSNNILEIGAGSGRLACDLLTILEKNNHKIDKYYILEVSENLKQRQQDLIFKHLPHMLHKVYWLDQLPTNFSGVIIANEVIDAMPISRFHYTNNTLQEYYVTLDNQNFTYVLDKPSEELKTIFNNINIPQYINSPYTSEINLWVTPWIKSLSECLHNGAILLCDYGFPRKEYYHPDRNTGTLICHYAHKCNTNPFLNIGLQDITAHVDFTLVAEAADANNLSIAGYTNLTSFLINCGILDLIDVGSIHQQHELNLLTSPAEMGELFKVMALTKNLQLDLLGFNQFDKTHCL